MTARRRLGSGVRLALLLCLLATACGGDQPATGEGPGTASTATPAAGQPSPTTASDYPVTIEHAQGTTTIESRPDTIISLSVQWTDALLAMDAPPAAYVLDSASGETDPYPWHAEMLVDTTLIEMAGEIPFEELATVEPDLILVTHQATDPALFDRLAQIAPTIGLLGDRQVDRWQDQVEVLGRVLDNPERAHEVIAGVEGQIADLADQLPALEGKTYALANYVPGDSIWVVADPNDGASELFNQLGMQLPKALLDAADGATGRVQLSFEQVGLLESDLLGILSNGGDPRELPGYDTLRSVQTGAVTEMVFADVVGVNTPTPISLPYVLDLLHPALEAAAAA